MDAATRGGEIHYRQPSRRSSSDSGYGYSSAGAAALRGGPVRGGAVPGRKSGGWLIDFWSDCVNHAKTSRVDLTFLALIIIMLVIGVAMLYSASYPYAYYFNEGNGEFYLLNQLKWAVFGFVLMFAASCIPPRYFYKSKWMVFIFVFQFLLLVAVYAMPAKNGVHRWIIIGGFQFQPSEITKFAVILFCAWWCTRYKDYMNEALIGMMVPAFPVFLCIGLVAFERHASCAILLVLIFVTMMFMGGSHIGWFIALGVVVGAAVLLFSSNLDSLSKIPVFGGVFADRFGVYFDPFIDPQGKGWQNIQGLYAIASGGLLGQGISNSRQKYLYVSEPQNDFIFSVVAEELGFVGSVGILLLFAVIVWRGFTIAMSNPDRFQKLVGIGITAQIGWQVILNIAVVTKVVPNTGISLPFFSYGGTSLAMLMMEVGVLLAISRTSHLKKE